MLLDLNQSDQERWARPKPNEGARLPASDSEGFEAAWNEGRLFSQSSANANAQVRAIGDYVDEVRRKTGTDLTDAASHIVVNSDWSAMDKEVAKLNAANPDLGLTPLTPEEATRRAVLLSRQARQTYVEQAAGEGGGFGRFLGGLASGATDPFNIAAAPLGGGGGGILLTALKFGGAAAASQIANEAAQSDYREKVQPGYGASGEPGANILEAGASGFLLGAGTKVLGNLWGRVKTGAWPTSVRDAGNAIESEAHTAQTNVYPGVAGEVAHHGALTDAIDNVLKGEPVDVAAHITPDVAASAEERVRPLMEARAAAQRSEAAAEAARPAGPTPGLPFEQTAAAAEANSATSNVADHVQQVGSNNILQRPLGHGVFVEGDRAFIPGAPTEDFVSKIASGGSDVPTTEALGTSLKNLRDADRNYAKALGMTDAEFDRMRALNRRIDEGDDAAVREKNELVRNFPDPYRLDLADEHQIRQLKTEYESLERSNGETLDQYKDGVARVLKRYISQFADGDDFARAVFRKAFVEAQKNGIDTKALGNDVINRFLGELSGADRQFMRDEFARLLSPKIEAPQTIPREGAERLAKMIVKADEPHAQAIIDAIQDRPQTVADFPPAAPPKAAETELLTPRTPTESAQVLASPDHEAAIRADIDRARATSDVKIPAGVDERGDPIFRSLDSAMDEVDAFKKAADEIQACANPVQEAAE